MGIKLTEGPNRLVAFSKALLDNWLQVVAFCDLLEHTGFAFTWRKGIGRMTAKLNALLASGRLVTMAIIRMFFQDSFTGSAAEFAKNGSRENVLQRRAAKSKHGRFSL